jgi:hypothetical protein
MRVASSDFPSVIPFSRRFLVYFSFLVVTFLVVVYLAFSLNGIFLNFVTPHSL